MTRAYERTKKYEGVAVAAHGHHVRGAVAPSGELEADVRIVVDLDREQACAFELGDQLRRTRLLFGVRL